MTFRASHAMFHVLRTTVGERSSAYGNRSVTTSGK